MDSSREEEEEEKELKPMGEIDENSSISIC
jgi:hypothetical protein